MPRTCVCDAWGCSMPTVESMIPSIPWREMGSLARTTLFPPRILVNTGSTPVGDASSAFLPGLSFDTVQRREEPRPALSEPRTEPSRSQNPDGSSEHDIRLVGLGLSMSRIDVLRDKTEKRRRPVPSLHLRVILARTAVNRRRCLRTQAFNGLSRVITQEVYGFMSALCYAA